MTRTAGYQAERSSQRRLFVDGEVGLTWGVCSSWTSFGECSEGAALFAGSAKDVAERLARARVSRPSIRLK